jgi:uncharacterized protein
LILPLVTALLAVISGLGMMGLVEAPMDALNVTTPILIFAVAAGHAVQILKRYYEEYHRLSRSGTASASATSRQAVVESLTRVGPVMLAAGIVAGLGFLSLVVFEVATIRTFGVFTALGIFSALILELTFIPALRSVRGFSKPTPAISWRRRERSAGCESVWSAEAGPAPPAVSAQDNSRVGRGRTLGRGSRR